MPGPAQTVLVLGIGKPLPRAGFFAHAQAHAVADTVTAAVTVSGETGRLDGHGGCFIGTGNGRAAYWSGDFSTDPSL